MSRSPISHTLKYLSLLPTDPSNHDMEVPVNLCTLSPLLVPDSQELVKEPRLLKIIEDSLGLRLTPAGLGGFRSLGMPYKRIGKGPTLYRPNRCLAWLIARHITPTDVLPVNYKEVA